MYVISPTFKKLILKYCKWNLQGIQFLLENDLLQQTPEDISQFLYKGEGLNKTVIGDYLGERWASSVLYVLDSWQK